MKLNSRPIVFVLLLLGCFVCASAQTYRGTLRGTVLDPNGAVIPGAEIKVTSKETSETRSVISGDEGQYSISSLRPGSYELTATAPGFHTFQRTIDVAVNQELRLDLDLSIGFRGDGVEIEPTDLREDSASLSTVIANNQVTGLPLDGRNFF